MLHLIVPLNPDFNCSQKLLSSSVDKVATGTYNCVSFISNVAFVSETFTPGTAFETFSGLSSVAATGSPFALLNIMQSLDQVKVKYTSQLNNGISKPPQKLLKCFNGTVTLTFSLFALTLSPNLTITVDL